MKTLNYATRFLIRAKSYTIINLLGLAFSLTCCIILMRYIHRELTVDTHCVDRENVYAIKIAMEGSEHLSGITQYTYDTVKIDKRYIDKETHFTPLAEDFIDVDNQRFMSRTIVTDSVYFELFSYPLVQGQLLLDKPARPVCCSTWYYPTTYPPNGNECIPNCIDSCRVRIWKP